MPSPRSGKRRCLDVGGRAPSRTLVLGLAILAVAAMGAVAVAASSTLATGKAGVKGKSKSVVVDSQGVTLYTLSGESVGRVTKLKCVNTVCFKAWPPYKTIRTAKLTKTAGVKGTVGRLQRVKGKFYQVMLDGHPLYTFAGDHHKKGSAKGEGITAFGGTWRVAVP